MLIIVDIDEIKKYTNDNTQWFGHYGKFIDNWLKFEQYPTILYQA